MPVVSELSARGAQTAPPRVDVLGEAHFKAMVNAFVKQYTARPVRPRPQHCTPLARASRSCCVRLCRQSRPGFGIMQPVVHTFTNATVPLEYDTQPAPYISKQYVRIFKMSTLDVFFGPVTVAVQHCAVSGPGAEFVNVTCSREVIVAWIENSTAAIPVTVAIPIKPKEPIWTEEDVMDYLQGRKPPLGLDKLANATEEERKVLAAAVRATRWPQIFLRSLGFGNRTSGEAVAQVLKFKEFKGLETIYTTGQADCDTDEVDGMTITASATPMPAPPPAPPPVEADEVEVEVEAESDSEMEVEEEAEVPPAKRPNFGAQIVDEEYLMGDPVFERRRRTRSQAQIEGDSSNAQVIDRRRAREFTAMIAWNRTQEAAVALAAMH